MNNPAKVIGTHNLGQLVIDIIETEPCHRLTQYGKGLAITCQCTSCSKRGQTPAEAKAGMDKIYKAN